MALPVQLRPHKDKIIYVGLLAGGAFAAALKFELFKIETLQGLAGWIVMGASALGLYTFNAGFIKMRRKKPAGPPTGQPDLRYTNPADLPPADVPEATPAPPPPGGRGVPQPGTKEDVFSEFNQ